MSDPATPTTIPPDTLARLRQQIADSTPSAGLNRHVQVHVAAEELLALLDHIAAVSAARDEACDIAESGWSALAEIGDWSEAAAVELKDIARLRKVDGATPRHEVERAMREGFELAVDCAELCDEATCEHDKFGAHINWTSARETLEEAIRQVGSKEGK